ncbi:MAG: glycosyltransferase [Planctomycetota bacterium]
MRVLHVISTLDPGGAENALLDLARGLQARGLTQTVAHLIGPGSMAPQFRSLGIEVLKSPFESFPELPLTLFHLHSLMEAHDLTHSHLLKANSLCSLAAPAGRPLVGSRHNDERILERPWVAVLHRMLSRKEQAHVAISPAVRDYYIGKGLEAEKFTVIPYGFEPVSAPPREDLRKEFGLGEGPLLLHAGRLVPQKGQAFLVEAVAAIPGASLLVCGEGPLRGDLESRVSALGLAPRVRFLGRRADLARLMVSSDLFVLPSLWEGLGRVLLECMDLGLPVVASDVSAIPGVLGDTGWLAKPGSTEALASAIRQALADKDSWPSRRERMRSRLRGQFSVSAYVEAHRQLYERLRS